MDRKGFATRVRQFLKRRFGGTYAFAHEPLEATPRRRGKTRVRAQRFPYATLKKWTRLDQPQVPVEQSLVEFGLLTGVSLNWLVFGSGDELRDVPIAADDLEQHLQHKLEAELRSAGFKPLEIRASLPESSEILEETLQYWLDRAKRDRQIKQERFSGHTVEQVAAVVRAGSQFLKEKGIRP
jgi:hypothetical protein